MGGAVSTALDRFKRIWAVDFEYVAPPGERPDPVCMVALELRLRERARATKDIDLVLHDAQADLAVALERAIAPAFRDVCSSLSHT